MTVQLPATPPKPGPIAPDKNYLRLFHKNEPSQGVFFERQENSSSDLPGQNGLARYGRRHQRANCALDPHLIDMNPPRAIVGRRSGASAGALVIESSKLHDG